MQHELTRDPSRAAFWALMGSGLFWGLMWWPLQFFAARGLTGFGIALTAYVIVGAAGLPLLWRQRRQWHGERGLLLAIGVLFGMANIAFTSALTMGSVVRAMLLFYLLPAWGAIGGWLFLRERPDARRLLAVVLSLTGVAVVLGAATLWRNALSPADGIALFAGICYSGASIANRRAQTIPLASRTLAPFVAGAVLAWAMLWSAPLFGLDPALRLPAPSVLTASWAWLLPFAGLWLTGATLLASYGVTHVAAARAAVLQVVELLVAVLSAVLLGGEALGVKECVGGALIIVATLLEARNAPGSAPAG